VAYTPTARANLMRVESGTGIRIALNADCRSDKGCNRGKEKGETPSQVAGAHL
jgi:hypothetical protein